MPPRLPRLLLARLLSRERAEFVLGDMEEMYARRRATRGRLRADLWYWRAATATLMRSLRGRSAASGLALDVRAAARGLRRTPGFTLIASGTLALGLGASVAVYGLADALLLRAPAGVHDAEGAVYIDFPDGDGVAYLSPADVDDLRDAAEPFLQALTAVASQPQLHVATGDADPLTAHVAFVDGPLFDLLGVRPLHGRLPGAGELSRRAPATIAVIGESLWSTLFARDPGVIGSTVRVNGHALTIVGITADGFAGLERAAPVDVWLPSSALVPVLEFDRERLEGRQAALYPHLIARLRVDVAAPAATQGLADATERIVASLPDAASTLQGTTPRLHASIATTPDTRPRVRQSLRILAGVVALVLVVACANVANLLLFRALRSSRELALRRALGASRIRLVGQQMVGHALLALAALAAAPLVAWAIARPFIGRTLAGMPWPASLPIDVRLLLFACAAATATALLAGIVPAWLAARTTHASPARADAMRTTARHETLRRAMTAVQLTASLALLVTALMLARTVRTLSATDPGYPTDDAWAVALEFPASHDMSARLAAFARAEAATAAAPGVTGAALDVGGPLVSRLRGPVVRSDGDNAERTMGIVTFVAPGWFELMDVRILRGRAFASEDAGPAGAGRVILNAGLARTLFGEQDPIGRTLRAFGRREEVEVIGVAEDIRYADILGDPEPVVYHPWSRPLLMGTTVVLFRGSTPPDAVRDAITRAVPELAVEMPEPLAARRDAQLADHTLFARLLGLLSLLAAALAGVGLYGVVAYGVAERTREFGIRMALGARTTGITGLVLRQTALTVGIGITFGLAAALLLARAFAARLTGMAPADPLTCALAVATLCGIAGLACVVPVRNATRVDPMTVLREE